MKNRRRFMRDCSAVALSAAFWPGFAISRRERALAEIDFDTFAALVNSRFVSRCVNSESQSLELVEATGGREVFSLLFRGDAGKPLQQDTYQFEHSRIGRFELFIVPVGRSDQSHCQYEAVFNRTPVNEFYG